MDPIELLVDQSEAIINKEDLTYLLPILIRRPVRVVVEIGTWRGYSLQLWDRLFRPELLITVEKDLNAIEFIQKRVARGEFRKQANIYQVVGDSTQDQTIKEVADLLGGRSIDFLFIDGDHRLEQVKMDFYNYGSLVAEEGVIAFHGISQVPNPEVEVFKFWEAMKRDYSYVEVKSRTSTGMGLLFL